METRTANITGLSLFPQYLTLLFEIDGLVLNDDRHLNNIAVIARDSCFDYCPIFDQGAGLLSNVMYNPFEIIPKSLIAQAKARPFQTTFNRQIRAMENLYGKQLEIPDFTRTQLAQKVLVENICGRRLRHAFVQHLQLYLFPRRLQETEQPNGRDGESDGNAILRSPV